MPVRSGNVNIGMCVSFGENVGVSVKTEVYVPLNCQELLIMEECLALPSGFMNKSSVIFYRIMYNFILI